MGNLSLLAGRIAAGAVTAGRDARAAFRTSLENPAIPLSSASIVQYLGAGSRTSAGVDVSPETALRHMAVWRAVTLTAGTVAELPLKVYRDTPAGARVEKKPPLFANPVYPDMTWFEFLETTVLHIMLYGNAYSLKIRNQGGDRILRLLPIDPSTVEVTRAKPTEENPSGKLFKLSTGAGDEPLTDHEIMHIPGISRDGLCGMSPIDAARNAIGVGLAAEDVAGRMYESGLLNGGILQAEVDLTDDEAATAKRRWREKVGGLVRAHEIAIVSAGFKYQPATIPPKDAQWLEARQFSVQEIARLYGVPADLLMENSATGNTAVDQRAMAWVRFGLNSMLNRIESRFSVHLLADKNTFCEFDVDGLLRGDTKTQAEVMQIEIGAGVLTIDEARAAKNRPPLPKPDPAPAPPPPLDEDQGDEGEEEDEEAT